MKEPGLQWLQAPVLTLVAILLITLASGGTEFIFGLTMSVVIFAGVGTIYLLFPGSRFFSISLANFLAVYACVYVFLVETNFLKASDMAGKIGFMLPVAAFIGGALLRRREVQEIISEAPRLGAEAVGRGLLWLLPLAVIGMLSFAVPMLAWSADQESVALLASMTLVSLLVFLLSPSIGAFLLFAGQMFDHFFDRVVGLVIPAFAFMTFYSLQVILFACLYRIIDLYVPGNHFNFNGAPYEPSFSDSLYFSIVTMSTLGYGDIAPASQLIRALTAIEIVSGVLLLLFGFSEIMRYVQDREQATEGPAKDRLGAGSSRRLDTEEEGVEHRDEEQGQHGPQGQAEGDHAGHGEEQGIDQDDQRQHAQDRRGR